MTTRPLPVTTISIIQLIISLLGFILLPQTILASGVANSWKPIIYLFIGSIASFMSVIGLWRMKRWGLYIFTANCLFVYYSVISYILTVYNNPEAFSSAKSNLQIYYSYLLIYLITFLYLITIRKKFN